MKTYCATHSGKFHADDVLAWALIQQFHHADAVLIRSRDKAVIAGARIVFDVGGLYSPQELRFDHHQRSYAGQLSSAGMVLDWLHHEEKIDPMAYRMLKTKLVDYVDAVDNGIVETKPDLPCFAGIVNSFNFGCSSLSDFDAAFQRAAAFAKNYVCGLLCGHQELQDAKQTVLDKMEEAVSRNTNVMEFEKRIPWRDTYFESGGENHQTEFIIHPNLNGAWQAESIPPQLDSFAQKKSFPEKWAGLRDEELAKVTGEPSAVFCHKNRFIAVFKERDALYRAMRAFNLIAK